MTLGGTVIKIISISLQMNEKVQVKCYDCGETFGTRSNMWRHKRTAHQGYRFDCCLCEAVFTRKESLKSHLKSRNQMGREEHSRPAQPIITAKVPAELQPTTDVTPIPSPSQDPDAISLHPDDSGVLDLPSN